MTKAIRKVEEVGHAHGIEVPMQGTVAVADGATVWAFRYSSAGRTRTLFHSVDMATLQQMYPDSERLQGFGRAARVIVSEPLTDMPGVFVEVPEATVAILDAGHYRHETFFAEPE
jgi:glutamine amidotransferase